MRILLFSICFISMLSACKQAPTDPTSNVPEHWANIPEVMMKGLEAHGGLEAWSKMNTMEFSFPKGDATELHQVDLPSRKVRISHPNYTVGFDGQEAWVIPNKEAFGTMSPRFYHNLIFYFYAIPYVLADPGINYEVLPDRTINGKVLDAIKISFNDGVGDAPDDYYIAHFDKESHEFYFLLYTVTYFSGETNENFGALIYDNWTEVNGLKVPQSMKGYKFAADTLGEQRYERIFDHIKLTEESLNDALFEIPDGGVIDSLIQLK